MGNKMSGLLGMMLMAATLTSGTHERRMTESRGTYYKKGNSYWYKSQYGKKVQITKAVYNMNTRKY